MSIQEWFNNLSIYMKTNLNGVPPTNRNMYCKVDCNMNL